MPKKVVRGVGMTQREIIQHEARDSKEFVSAVNDFFKAQPVELPGDMPGDALDRENAERFRAILATAGLADLMDGKCAVDCRPLIAKGLNEASAQWIAAHWLAAYQSMLMQRQRLVDEQTSRTTIGKMLMDAQEMGRLQERMWWRAGVDPKTGKKRESLAVGKQKQEMAIGKATNARRIQAQDINPDWHEAAVFDAMEIKQRHPSYSRWRIAGEIYEKFGITRGRCDKVLRANGIE